MLAAVPVAASAQQPAPSSGESSAVAVRQTDGKVITIEDSNPCEAEVAQCASGFAVSRYESSGMSDPTFGSAGTVVTMFGRGVVATPTSVAIDPQGRIVVAGTYSTGNRHEDFVLARYLPDGTLDPTFGIGGVARSDLADDSQDLLSALAVAPDGKLLAYGLMYTPGSAVLVFARYSDNGTLDATFGDGGIARVDLTGLRSAGPVTIQADGKAVALAVTGEGSALDLVVVRLESSGALDRAFGEGGSRRVSRVSGDWDRLEARYILIDGGGRIIAGGTQNTGEHCCFDTVLARLTPEGSPDSGFGANSGGVAKLPGTLLGGLTSLADGNLLVAGTAPWALFVAKLDPNGTPLSAYNAGGKGTLSIAGHVTIARAIFPEPDGGALALAEVLGARCPAPGRVRGRACNAKALVRYGPSGRLDRRFGGTGFTTRPPIHYCPQLPYTTCGIDIGAGSLKRLVENSRPRKAHLRSGRLALRVRCDHRIETYCRIATRLTLGSGPGPSVEKTATLPAGQTRQIRLHAPRGLTRRAAAAANGELPLRLRQRVRANGLSTKVAERLRLLTGLKSQ